MEGRRVFAELTVDENLVAGGYTSRDKAAVAAAHERVMDAVPAARRAAQAGRRATCPAASSRCWPSAGR